MNLSRILILALSITLNLYVVTYCATLPSDVEGQTYEKAVSSLFEKGIITGDEYGNYNPNQTLTRAQACIIVVKSMKPPIDQVVGTASQDYIDSGFPDMSGYSWAEGYIGYAVRSGVTKGYPDGSFKPGNKVTSSELVTMILRAAGYSDADLQGLWPTNYENKGLELKLYENVKEIDEMPQFATKWIAAQMDYNAIDLIESANVNIENYEFGIPKQLPDLNDLKFKFLGRFDSNMTTFSEIPISKDVKVYTYGTSDNYVAEMEFSTNKNDYKTETEYKYKNAITPAFYKTTDNKITMILLPQDVGYTGSVFCVINKISDGVLTLTAAKSIKWEYDTGVKNIPFSREMLEGSLYNLNILDGKIKSSQKVTDLTDGYAIVEEHFINGPVKVSANNVTKSFEISKTATVYINDSQDNMAYKSGNLLNIREGSMIKLFDISNNGRDQVDIIILKEK